ncbi:nucleotide sugar dehydrogenase [Streptomyces europaeiscabiei]|uniref:nucleotide sugar dehydrogenase n=1 Tax=Streptomyces europaeiscabiei TaxID=146819 RepID=UPI0029B1790C|nr:nucleotide sugar dehydrogenase [Streptomyces europaeiscabiei]MDX2525301.1 nucleotide sugar dehydrogenase [Streptomyces europaeiscabiei]
MVSEQDPSNSYIAVIGLGYVGLPLAASLAAHHRVIGVDTNPAVRAAVDKGTAPFREPGLDSLLQSLPPGALTIADALPEAPPDAVVICVGTPVHALSAEPDMTQLKSAVEHVAQHMADTTLVVVRSTVSVGTCRGTVLPILRTAVASPLLAFCPERIIQGRALHELTSLPQIVGGLDQRSTERAGRLLACVAPDRVTVSSIEAAEMIKLICNAHTDLIYGFGNEVALLADRLGLDAHELIESANLRYPRPDLSRPGFVGGSCLTKDPYLLLHAARRSGHHLPMVAAARAVNESLPGYAVERVTQALRAAGHDPGRATVLVGGIAYKGRPATDDVRGAASGPVAEALRDQVGVLRGHDFEVAPENVDRLGFLPTGLDEGLRGASALILLTDHPGYGGLRAERLLSLMSPSPVVFDMWGSLHTELSGADGLTYIGLGHG